MRGHNPTTSAGRIPAVALAALIAASGLSLTPTEALAQGTSILEEITVTAQRREENLQEVPISVTAISGERLESLFEGGEDVRALATRIPSLYAESSNGRLAPRFYMRGLGNTDFDLAASQSVSILFDEVVQENVILKSFPLFDLDRVEVLRGPQGTLFGRNTPAGIVHFHTRKPSEEFDGYAQVTLGNVGTANVEGAVGGSLNSSDTLMGRVSILSQNRDDWIDNTFTGEKDAMGGFNEFAYRGQLLWAPNDVFSGLLNVHGRNLSNGTASIFRANILTTGSNELNSNFTRDQVFFNGGDNNPQEANATGASLKLDFDFANDVTLTSITAYETVDNRSLGDIDGGNDNGPGFIPFQTDTQDGLDDLDQVTQEFRLSSNASDNLFWQAGVFYFDSQFDVTTVVFFAPSTTLRHENQAWAAFGQVSLDFASDWNVTAGVRYTDDQKDLRALASNFPVSPVTVEDSNVTGDISLMYSVSDNANLYGRFASGFRAPTIQGRDVAFFGAPSVAQSETINSIEGGFKTTLANDRIRLNGSVYYYQINDQQLTAIGGTGNNITLINADKGNGSGFDLDAEWLPTDNIYVTLGWSYNNTEIDDPALRIPVCGSGQCTPLDTTEVINIGGTPTTVAIVNGNSFPQSPETIINLTFRYETEVYAGQAFFMTDWAYQTDTHMFLYESAEYNSGNIFEGGVRTGFIHESGTWQLSLFGRNITDEENLKGGIDFNNNTGFVNDRRIWGATLKVNFGSL